MIDIQPYLDKLDKLREYMECRIDNQPFEMWMDLQFCPDRYYIDKGLPLPKPYPVTIRFAPNSFDEFLINDYKKLTWN